MLISQLNTLKGSLDGPGLFQFYKDQISSDGSDILVLYLEVVSYK
jgi:hypothetical protein